MLLREILKTEQQMRSRGFTSPHLAILSITKLLLVISSLIPLSAFSFDSRRESLAEVDFELQKFEGGCEPVKLNPQKVLRRLSSICGSLTLLGSDQVRC